MKKILITGGSGFIGTNLIEALKKAGYSTILNLDISPPINIDQNCYWKVCSIMEFKDLEKIFLEFRPTWVVHLAARTDCNENTTVEDGYQVNTVGTANVLKSAKRVPEIKRVIITSTQFVFNKGAILPKNDEDYAAITVYGQSKIECEKITRKEDLSFCWTIIRPTNVWGPWHMRHQRQFFRILKWGLYFHPGSTPVFRSYAYVGNVVNQIIKILDSEDAIVNRKIFYVGDAPLNIFNWANAFSNFLYHRNVRIIPRNLLKFMGVCGDLISKLTGKEFYISSSRYSSMTSDYLTPMDKTFEVLGKPPYSLEEGVQQTIAWARTYKSISKVEK